MYRFNYQAKNRKFIENAETGGAFLLKMQALTGLKLKLNLTEDRMELEGQIRQNGRSKLVHMACTNVRLNTKTLQRSMGHVSE